MSPKLRWNRMLSPARTAWDDRQGETHCASPEDKREALALESAGLVTIRKTTVKCAGFDEWWVKLTAKGVAETEPRKGAA